MLAEMLAQAQDQTVASATRTLLTFIIASLVCALSLFTPDSSLLIGEERQFALPFAGQVSFPGFLVVGSVIVIALRVYLQIYAEHWQRLEKIRNGLPSPIRPPALAPMRNSVLRWFARFALYLLLPLMMFWFAWKAAIFPAWGSVFACLAVAVSAGHLVLFLPWRWPARMALTALVAIFAAVIVYSEGPLSRPAALFRADLSNQWLPGSYLRGANLQHADLRYANLSDANLQSANLEGAELTDANLRNADLSFASLVEANLEGQHLIKLEGANLSSANLSDAWLQEANLRGASLELANLTNASLLEANLEGAMLGSANLTRADLEAADLAFAHLQYAKLEEAFLHEAILFGADLSYANLKGAILTEVSLQNAKLEGADLTDADLRDASLWPTVGLTREQLKTARCNEGTVLPPDLKPERDCGSWSTS